MDFLLINPEYRDGDDFSSNWDIDVADGLALTVEGTVQEDQEANVIAYLEKTTIPLMEDKGIDWSGFLLKRCTIAEIDTKIRENIKTYLDTVLYSPVYFAEEGALKLRMAKTVINTGAVQ